MTHCTVMDHVYLSVSDIPQSPASLSLGYLLVSGNSHSRTSKCVVSLSLTYPSVLSISHSPVSLILRHPNGLYASVSGIPQSRASLSLGHLSVLRASIPDYKPQSPASLSLRQSLSEKPQTSLSLENRSVLAIR